MTLYRKLDQKLGVGALVIMALLCGYGAMPCTLQSFYRFSDSACVDCPHSIMVANKYDQLGEKWCCTQDMYMLHLIHVRRVYF